MVAESLVTLIMVGVSISSTNHQVHFHGLASIIEVSFFLPFSVCPLSNSYSGFAILPKFSMDRQKYSNVQEYCVVA